MKQLDVVIIGAGTAGLSARREVAKVTDQYVVIDDGPLGTTCARVGCMPSKVLIEVANMFQQRHKFAEVGIDGAANLTVNHRDVMAHVRKLRDRFVRGVWHDMETWEKTHLLRGRAAFVDKNTLRVGDHILRARSIIIATGSQPVMPSSWREHSDFLIDTDQFFEMESLPQRVAVIGLGVIGLELGQALNRLGVEVVGIGLGKAVGGLTDPDLQDYGLAAFRREFPVFTDGVEELSTQSEGLLVKTPTESLHVDRAFLTMGRKPNLAGLDFATTGVALNDRGLPEFAQGTYRVKDSNIFLVGDVNAERPILHEAADEGRIAGYNAVRDVDQCFKRRTNMGITFTDPNIAFVGRTYAELEKDGIDFVVGRASFEGQGRAIVKLKEVGALHIYADRKTGKLLGSEMFAPDGEHLAHLVGWAVEAQMTVFEVLSLPFYHPVIEEGLRTALRKAAEQVDVQANDLETMRCQDAPVGAFAQEG